MVAICVVVNTAICAVVMLVTNEFMMQFPRNCYLRSNANSIASDIGKEYRIEENVRMERVNIYQPILVSKW